MSGRYAVVSDADIWLLFSGDPEIDALLDGRVGLG